MEVKELNESELKDICFVCNSKWCKTCGGMIVKKPETIYDDKKKKQYIIFRFAPLGCYLAHNDKDIKDFYKDRELVRIWKSKKKGVRNTKNKRGKK